WRSFRGLDILGGGRHARDLCGVRWHLGRKGRTAKVHGSSRHRMGARLFYCRTRYCHRPVVAGLLWLRFHRRYRIGHRLYFSGINPHEMVPRPPWTSYRVSDHGFWWRCTDCQPVISSANEVIWWRYRNRGPCHRFGAHLYYTGNQLRRAYCRRSICDSCNHADWAPAGWDPTGVTEAPMRTNLNVSANEALKTPQFWFLWVVLFTNVTAGIGILENAAPM